MADATHIEWTDATWNPVTGCSVVSPGCTNCYAMQLAGTRLAQHPSRAGLTRPSKAGPVWTGEVRLNEQWLTQPLQWKRPRMIFVCAHGDLFHEDVPGEWIDRVFAVMALAEHLHMCPAEPGALSKHVFQILTKRQARMRAYIANLPNRDDLIAEAAQRVMGGNLPAELVEAVKRLVRVPLPNVWLGISAEDQRRADERREDLAQLAGTGWLTFVSYEPALGPIDWSGWAFLSWLISGGENGPRPSHPDWHRASRDFCAAHGIPYFFKQWGTWYPQIDRERDDPDWRQNYSHRFGDNDKTRWLNLAGGRGFHGERFHVMGRVGKKRAGRLLDGVEHNAMPEVARC